MDDAPWQCAPTLEGRQRHVRHALVAAARDGHAHELASLLDEPVVQETLMGSDCVDLFRTLFLIACSKAHLDVAQLLYRVYVERTDVFNAVSRIALRPMFVYARAAARRRQDHAPDRARIGPLVSWLDGVVRDQQAPPPVK